MALSSQPSRPHSLALVFHRSTVGTGQLIPNGRKATLRNTSVVGEAATIIRLLVQSRLFEDGNELERGRASTIRRHDNRSHLHILFRFPLETLSSVSGQSMPLGIGVTLAVYVFAICGSQKFPYICPLPPSPSPREQGISVVILLLGRCLHFTYLPLYRWGIIPVLVRHA